MYSRFIFVVISVFLSCPISYGQAKSSLSSGSVITVYLDSFQKYDSLALIIYRASLGGSTDASFLHFKEKQVAYSTNNHFTFNIKKIGGAVNVSLKAGAFVSNRNKGGKWILLGHLLMPGDNVVIRFNGTGVSFSGKGSERFSYKNELDTVIAQVKSQFYMPPLPPKMQTRVGNALRFIESAKSKDSALSVYISKRNPWKRNDLTGLLSTNALYAMRNNVLDAMVTMLLAGGNNVPEVVPLYKQYLDDMQKFQFPPNRNIAEHSAVYIEFLKNYELVRFIVTGRQGSYFDTVVEGYSGLVRDKLLVKMLFDAYATFSNADSMVRRYLQYVKSSALKEGIIQFHKMRMPGSDAIDFSLESVSRKQVRLSDFKGKVVFMDFWYTGCGPCIKYFQEAISVAEKAFANNPEVVFLSINVGADKERWLAEIQNGIYTSKDVINLYTGKQGWEHPILEDFGIVAAPQPILIGKDGKIISRSSTELGHSLTEHPQVLINAINKALLK